MSDTPRTDAEFKFEAFFDGAGIVETVLVEFAEQLETEFADTDKQLTEARADAEHWKSECNALQRMVHEARAEIERLKCHLEDESMRADGMTTAHAEADARNYRLQELIEQMREALQEVMVLCDAVPTRAHDMAKDYHLREIGRIVNAKGLYHVVKAALSAAERELK